MSSVYRAITRIFNGVRHDKSYHHYIYNGNRNFDLLLLIDPFLGTLAVNSNYPRMTIRAKVS